VVWAGLIASKLAPAGDLGRAQNLRQMEIYCGSELARDGVSPGIEKLRWLPI